MSHILREYADLLAGVSSLVVAVWASLRLRTAEILSPSSARPSEHRILRGVALAASAVAIVGVVATARFEPTRAPWLVLGVAAAAVCLASGVTVLCIHAFGTYSVKRDGAYQRAVGGLRLTPYAMTRRGEAMAAGRRWSMESMVREDPKNMDIMWTRSSRTVLYAMLLGGTVTFIVSAASSLSIAGALVMSRLSPAMALDRAATALEGWATTVAGDSRLSDATVRAATSRLGGDPLRHPELLRLQLRSFLTAWEQGPSARDDVDQHTLSRGLITALLVTGIDSEYRRTYDDLMNLLDNALSHFRHIGPPAREYYLATLWFQAETLLAQAHDLAAEVPRRVGILARVDAAADEIQRLGGTAHRLAAVRAELHYERARPQAHADVGRWDPSELQEAYALAKTAAESAGDQDTGSFALLLKVERRWLISGHAETGGGTFDVRRSRMERAKRTLDGLATARPTIDSIAVATACALYVHDYVYGVADPDDVQTDFEAALALHRTYVIGPLRSVKVATQADVSGVLGEAYGEALLDLARAHALEAEILQHLGKEEGRMNAIRNAAECLLEIDQTDRISSARRRRLLASLGSGRPEWKAIATDSRLTYLFAYAEAIVSPK